MTDTAPVEEGLLRSRSRTIPSGVQMVGGTSLALPLMCLAVACRVLHTHRTCSPLLCIFFIVVRASWLSVGAIRIFFAFPPALASFLLQR